MQPSALAGHPELTVHTGPAPGSFTLVGTRTGEQQPRPGRAGAQGWPVLPAPGPDWPGSPSAPRSEVLSRLHVSSLPPLGLGVPVRGGEGQTEPEEEPEAQSAGRGEAVRGRVLPLRGRRPAGAVRPPVLHQGLPPGLPGPGQAALRWVPALSPTCCSPRGPCWAGQMAVRVCGWGPAGRRCGPESEASGARVRLVAPGGGLEPSLLRSAGSRRVRPHQTWGGGGQMTGQPSGRPGRGSFFCHPKFQGDHGPQCGKRQPQKETRGLKDRNANSCEGKAGLPVRPRFRW